MKTEVLERKAMERINEPQLNADPIMCAIKVVLFLAFGFWLLAFGFWLLALAAFGFWLWPLLAFLGVILFLD